MVASPDGIIAKKETAFRGLKHLTTLYFAIEHE